MQVHTPRKKSMVNERVENNIMHTQEPMMGSWHTSNHPNPLPLSEVKWCGPQRDRTQATLECLPFTQTTQVEILNLKLQNLT